MPSINSSNNNRSYRQAYLPPAVLGMPPRPIPLLVRGRLLFGGFMNQFGWLWLAFSMIFVLIFIGKSGLKGLVFSFSERALAPGQVLRVEETNSSENDSTIYAIRYLFRVEQQEAEYYGVSYTKNYFSFAEGQQVQVEYHVATPANSRIQGTRMSPFGNSIACMMLFPLIGVVTIFGGMRLGIRNLRLLKHGHTAQGTLIRKEPTNTRINEQIVYKLIFEFVDAGGMRQQAIAKSHQTHTLEDEETERVLYDPKNPSAAVLLDNLPGRPAVDGLGRILPGSPLTAGLVLIFPALAVLLTALMFR